MKTIIITILAALGAWFLWKKFSGRRPTQLEQLNQDWANKQALGSTKTDLRLQTLSNVPTSTWGMLPGAGVTVSPISPSIFNMPRKETVMFPSTIGTNPYDPVFKTRFPQSTLNN
jgi:hypothetical protein